MIFEQFNESGRPLVDGHVVAPRLRVSGTASFLLDTGADNTLLHPRDSYLLGVSVGSLRNRMAPTGIGGMGRYFREPAVVVFQDGFQTRMYGVQLLVGEPSGNNRELPPLLGPNIINYWRVEYDPSNNVLECIVRHADYTLDIR